MTRDSRSLLIGILVLAGRKLTAAQLIRLAAPAGLSATNVKSHLTRMTRDGSLLRAGPRRLATYEPSPSQKLVIEGIRVRLAKVSYPSWDGTWLLLSLRLPQDRAERQGLRASLWFDGFRPVSPEVFVRPNWPLPWARERLRSYLHALPGMCFQGQFLGPRPDVCQLYDLDGLDAEARSLTEWIRRRKARATLRHSAFAERLKVGGRVALFIGHDPRLPPVLWGQRRGMAGIVHAFQKFEHHIVPLAQRFVRENLK